MFCDEALDAIEPIAAGELTADGRVAAHYLEGVQYEELAQALRLPIGTVKTQLYRAKQQLRRVLETDLKWVGRQQSAGSSRQSAGCRAREASRAGVGPAPVVLF